MGGNVPSKNESPKIASPKTLQPDPILSDSKRTSNNKKDCAVNAVADLGSRSRKRYFMLISPPSASTKVKLH